MSNTDKWTDNMTKTITHFMYNFDFIHAIDQTEATDDNIDNNII